MQTTFSPPLKKTSCITPWLLWFALIIASRLIPHPPNATFLDAGCFLAGALPSLKKAGVFALSALLLSDLFLYYFCNIPGFGYWTLYTYSGYALILACGYSAFKNNGCTLTRAYLYLNGASCVYWLWSNFAVWLWSGIYTHNAAQLLSCYSAALPFLRNELYANLIMPLCIFIFTYFPASMRIHSNKQLQA